MSVHRQIKQHQIRAVECHVARGFSLSKQILHDVYRAQGTVLRSYGKHIGYTVIVLGSGHQVVEYDEIIHRWIEIKITFQTVGDASHELYVGQGLDICS
jgi:hypothetical protein